MEREIEELKQLVRRNIELTKETRDIVDGMHRSARRGMLLRWGWKIALFALLAYGYYTYLWPYIQKIQAAATNVQNTGTQFADFFKLFGN